LARSSCSRLFPKAKAEDRDKRKSPRILKGRCGRSIVKQPNTIVESAPSTEQGRLFEAALKLRQRERESSQLANNAELQDYAHQLRMRKRTLRAWSMSLGSCKRAIEATSKKLAMRPAGRWIVELSLFK
jgi:hypothetical protein